MKYTIKIPNIELITDVMVRSTSMADCYTVWNQKSFFVKGCGYLVTLMLLDHRALKRNPIVQQVPANPQEINHNITIHEKHINYTKNYFTISLKVKQLKRVWSICMWLKIKVRIVEWLRWQINKLADTLNQNTVKQQSMLCFSDTRVDHRLSVSR